MGKNDKPLLNMKGLIYSAFKHFLKLVRFYESHNLTELVFNILMWFSVAAALCGRQKLAKLA